MNPIAGMLASAGTKKGLDIAYDVVKAVLAKHKSSLLTSEAEIEKALHKHQQVVKKWASQISFRELSAPRKTSDVFVPLDIYLSPRRVWFEGETLKSTKLEDAISKAFGGSIILGQPGAGKTTAAKHICERVFKDSSFLDKVNFVIKLELRELNTASPSKYPEYLSRAFQDILNLRFSFSETLEGDENVEVRKNIRDRVVIDWLMQRAFCLSLTASMKSL